MVEGPGCTRNGDRARQAVGQRVIAVSGHKAAAMLACMAGKTPLPDGAVLLSVDTVGKELFITLGPPAADGCATAADDDVAAARLWCVRLHFGMTGSLTLNGEATKYGTKPDFEVWLASGGRPLPGKAAAADSKIRCFGVGVTAVTAATPRRKLTQLGHLDVCSPQFNQVAAVAAVRSQGGRFLADVMLDQAILPGSGNVIKNEALHLAGCDPTTRVSTVPPDLLAAVLRHVREFSLKWYRGRRPPLRIYNRDSCRRCAGNIAVFRFGEDLHRVTFRCKACQPDIITLADQIERKRRAALQRRSEAQAKRRQVAAVSTTASGGVAGEPAATPHHTAGETEVKRQAALKRRAETEARRTRVCEGDIGGGGGADGQVAKRLRPIDCTTSTSTDTAAGAAITTVAPVPARSQQRCPVHGSALLVKRVHKAGPNKHRLFLTCPCKPCELFEWADGKFPLCKHKRRSILRTCFKTGQNNGRRFFCCSMPKAAQCNFFEWTVGEPLPGVVLRPLT